MELDSKNGLTLMPERGERIVRARSCRNKAGRGRFDMIAVTHPGGELLALTEPVEHPACFEHLYLGSSVLPSSRSLHFGTQNVRDELHAVADAKHGRNV